jgi:hypothetical protein
VAWYCQAPVVHTSAPLAGMFVSKGEEPGESTL